MVSGKHFRFLLPLSVFFLYTIWYFTASGGHSVRSVRFDNIPPSQFNGYVSTPAHISEYFPPPNPERKDYHEWNAQTLRELHACMAISNCGPNQKKVALLAAHWFEEATVRGWRGGEGIWGLSVYKGLRDLGYTTFFANSFEEALQQYRMFPDLVKVVIRNKAGECHSDAKCVKGPRNPSGIPAWKIFDFEFFASYGGHFQASLLKGKWILSANPDPRFVNEEDSPIQYIGYSVEEDCHTGPVIRLSDRANQVWMLMKQLTYVYNDKFAWNRSYFSLVSKELDINFVGGWQINQHYQWEPDVKGQMSDIEDREHRVTNLGRLNSSQFAQNVAISKVMVGVGSPWWSPSPYNALCQGVPFINPILKWDRNEPWERSSWYTQHPSLNRFEPPYVYHVHAGDWSGFVAAIKAASRTEIPSFIPNHMSLEAIRDRLTKLMETDWRAQAAALLKERLQEIKDGKKTYVFEL
ncbi:hypothetical protein CPB84DRAFT_1791109 [Gymnopilus junonius]|uniref:Glycosyltransferase family 18 catalytic domain-containing protein n=1 Tax=Gymnopilus junonius TaxID=109634 RepID=A0A9P5TIN0_GYMJU|nr:hypothetical protein CPB84DRAFT_1791109 [Gymnopilus junonius]